MARGMDRAGSRFREYVYEFGSRNGMKDTSAPTR